MSGKRSWPDSYKMFEKLTEEFEIREKEEESKVRDENQFSYMRRQREKQLKWDSDMRSQGKDPEKIKAEMAKNSCGCASNNLNMAAEFLEKAKEKKAEKKAEKHGHGHAHTHTQKDGKEKSCGDPNCVQSRGPIPKLTCGYADPATLQRLAEEKKKKPQLSLPEKNRRKMIAVEATQIDGNKFFKEGKLETALAIYERGCMIINGCYGMPDEDWDKMQDAEAKLDLNIALVKIKMKEWSSAIEHCRMSLNIRKKNPKGYYRWAEALTGMGEYEKALEKNAEALKIHPGSQGSLQQRERIIALKKKQAERSKQKDDKLAKALKKRWNCTTKKSKKKTTKSSAAYEEPEEEVAPTCDFSKFISKEPEKNRNPPAEDDCNQGRIQVEE